MKTLFLSTVLLLAIASPGWSEDKETDKALQALYERAAPIYQEEFNKLVEAGEFEPKLDAKSRWKEGTLERKLYLAGYYSAVVSYMDPSDFREKPEETGRGQPAGPGVKLFYNFGWLAGIRKTEPVARKLHTQIVAKLLGEKDAADSKNRDNPPPALKK
jgi:hypothetical protein